MRRFAREWKELVPEQQAERAALSRGAIMPCRKPAVIRDIISENVYMFSRIIAELRIAGYPVFCEFRWYREAKLSS